MADSTVVKNCTMCCMEIAAAAKKCPYCQHWQYKLTMLVHHPAYALLPTLPLIFILILVAFVIQSMTDPGEDFQQWLEHGARPLPEESARLPGKARW